MRQPEHWSRLRLWGYGALSLLLLASLTPRGWLERTLRGRSAPGGLASPIPVRPVPVTLTLYPIKEANLDEKDLIAAADVIRPYFQRNKVPVVLIYHAIRVWGRKTPFSEADVPVTPSEGLSGDGLFLRALTDQETYQKYSMVSLDRLLVPSPYGVQVVTSVLDAGWGQNWGSTHVGKYVQVMADLEMPSDTPLHLADGVEATLADVIRDEARRYHKSLEPEWLACGLSRYLATTRWQNRFQQWCSFDDIATRLVESPIPSGACAGTHNPCALATLLNVHQQVRILSKSRETEVRRRLVEYSRLLTRSQRADGSWDGRWWDSDAPPREGDFLPVALDKVLATGHHLEWMVLCPPDLRPEAPTLTRAAGYLARTLPLTGEAVWRDFHTYLPISHAVRGLVLASGRRWADPAWLRKAKDGS